MFAIQIFLFGDIILSSLPELDRFWKEENTMSIWNGDFNTRTLNMLERGMDASILRQTVLADNVANADTPGFKRTEVIFESELRRAIDSERKERENPDIQTNHPNHISQFGHRDYRNVHPVTHADTLSTMRNDGNNVDMEHEVSQQMRNQMQYSLMVERLGSQYRLYNNLIRLA